MSDATARIAAGQPSKKAGPSLYVRKHCEAKKTAPLLLKKSPASVGHASSLGGRTGGGPHGPISLFWAVSTEVSTIGAPIYAEAPDPLAPTRGETRVVAHPQGGITQSRK
jgi:hypothetical protein